MLASFCCAGYPSVPFFRLQMQLFILNSGWKSGAQKISQQVTLASNQYYLNYTRREMEV